MDDKDLNEKETHRTDDDDVMNAPGNAWCI